MAPSRAPVLPLPVAPSSNGEFVPAAPSPDDRDVYRATLALAEDAAGRAGMDRRDFLRTAGGVAAMLTVFNLAACSSGGGKGRTRPERSPGGTHLTPPSHDVAACEHALGTQGEFIFDVHTHHVMPDGPWRRSAPDTARLVRDMLPDCGDADPFECANRAAYLHDMFLSSDTTMAILSDVPNTGPEDAPLPFDDALGSQQLAETLTRPGAGRVLVHNVIAPNFGDLHARLDRMEAAAATRRVAAFKVYTAWGPANRGFALDDPAIGLPVLQKAHDLGVRVFIAHKGLPLVRFDPTTNGPRDIVAVSRQFPDMDFVVFHSAWDSDRREGPYNATARLGIDTLLAALDRYQVPPNSNVWVDLGTVWRVLLRNPDMAAHAIGKLLRRVGEDRVLWGTDAVWYGSPQPQIMAFRAFQIGASYQERYGYPALTSERKQKILGLNAARLFRIDPAAQRCALASDPLAAAKPAAAELHREGAVPVGWDPRGPTTRREILQWLASPATRWTPA
jgi:predicted TIM-barrel fold metal-dependent hydrolase